MERHCARGIRSYGDPDAGALMRLNVVLWEMISPGRLGAVLLAAAGMNVVVCQEQNR